MRHSIIFIPFLFALNSFGQIPLEVKNNLAKRDFSTFKKYAALLSKRTDTTKAYWDIEREITPGFEERVLIINKFVPHKEDPKISTVYTFRVNLIAKDNAIIFYELKELKSKKVNNEWVEYYSGIENYQNDSLFKLLQSDFLKSFSANLNKDELFVTTIIYGKQCGGVTDIEDSVDSTENARRIEEAAKLDVPFESYQIDDYVKNNDTKHLLMWLKSTTTEKQIYGVEGFYKLKLKGFKLTKEQLRIIKIILAKKGKVNVCSGCIYSSREINAVAKDFKF